jgi:hypothetical protein
MDGLVSFLVNALKQQQMQLHWRVHVMSALVEPGALLRDITITAEPVWRTSSYAELYREIIYTI